MMATKMDSLVLFANGQKVVDSAPDPTETLLAYLRRKLGLPGTKEGCGVGGCGACTVMISSHDVMTKRVKYPFRDEESTTLGISLDYEKSLEL
ncbi:xanthine dehydrogenase/oxidase-like [Mya arenaria]|uniref:xanthine dehydrogenase/oxidase-like n=1 Tax=Mya arenaria TaxID=6604 RepID=UPI0022E6DD5F|nr:xanthine dehydrogenase/oxidase-like [Mya arenaria]